MEGKKAAVFLDRDGTINVDYGYVYQKERLKFIEGSIEALRMLQNLGYLLIMITNQSGVARGYFTIEELEDFHDFMLDKLKERDVVIDGIYYCPHLVGCHCRKPGLELFYKAQKEFGIDFSRSYAIGDSTRDIAICESEPVKGLLITDNPALAEKNGRIRLCRDLHHAAQIIFDENEEQYVL